MSPRIADLGDMPALTAGYLPFQPGPPQGPPPTGPGTGDGGRPGPRVVDPGLTRWAPNANREQLTALLDDIERLLDGSVK